MTIHLHRLPRAGLLALLGLGLLIAALPAGAAPRSSEAYTLPTEVVASAGARSASAAYAHDGTLDMLASTAAAASASYTLSGGFVETEVDSTPPSGGTFTLDPAGPVEAWTPVTLTASGWTDESGPLTYRFLLTFQGNTSAFGPPSAANTFVWSSTIFPGDWLLTVEVADALGNVATATAPLTLTFAHQTITFNPPTTALSTDTIALSATGGGSGSPVTFSVRSGPGTIGAGNVLSFTGTGNVVVRASQAGNGVSYAAAPDVDRTIEVAGTGSSPLTLVNDGAFAGSTSVLIDVLGNDTTASGTLALVSVMPPVSGGTAVVEGARVRFTRVGAAGAPVTFTYTASNGSESATATVTVKSVSGAAGSYIGLLRRADGKVRGRVTATVTSTGLVTGTVRREGTSFSYKGSLLGAMSGATSAVMLPNPLRLAPGADGPTGQPTLAVSLPDTTGVQMLRGNAERASYSATNPAPQAGRYTIVANRPTGGSGPAVGAALTCVVTSQGVVTIGGKLGNGVMAAQSGRLLDGGRYPFYVSSGGGALMQNMAGEPVFNQSLVPAVSGALRWTVPNGADARLSGGLAQDYDAYGLIYTPGFNAAAMFNPSTPSALLTLPIPSFRAAPIVTSLNLTGTPYKGVQTVYFPPGVGKVLLSPGSGFFSGTRYASKYEYRTFFGVVQQGSVNAGKGIVLDVTSLQQVTLAP